MFALYFLMLRGHIYTGWDKCKYLCDPNNSDCRKKQQKMKLSAQVGRVGRGKALGRANSHEIPDASCQCGDRPRQLPKSTASPHASKAWRRRRVERRDAAKASPNVKWHLLNTRTRGCFHARVPGDLCGPN